MENHNQESFKPLTICVEKLPDSMARYEHLTSYAAERAKLLLGCFRTGQANDPETYVAAVTATLARYPEDVITKVTHPIGGLPATQNWLPTVKDVVDACDEAHEPILQHELRLKRIKDQMEMREREERGERPSYADLKSRYGDNWGIRNDRERQDAAPLDRRAILDHYKTHALDFQPRGDDFGSPVVSDREYMR